MNELLRRVDAAIIAAQCKGREGPYGLYDYSSYEGSAPPHQVRDFRDPRSADYGRTLFSSHDRDEAQVEFDRRTKEHVARSVSAAVLDAVATWYAETGWMLDEDAVPSAIRALVDKTDGETDAADHC